MGSTRPLHLLTIASIAGKKWKNILRGLMEILTSDQALSELSYLSLDVKLRDGVIKQGHHAGL